MSVSVLTLVLLPATLAAQAPWEVNAPIVSVTRQVYQTHPATAIAVNTSQRYVGPDRGAHSQRLEQMTWQKASDTPYNLRQRWSSDNGKTWTDWQAYDDPVRRLPGGERIYWGPGPSAYDPVSRKTVSIWLRQTQLGDGRFSNHSFVRLSGDSGRTWSDPQLLRYEDGADFDPADPLNTEFLDNNHAYFPQNVGIRRDGALVVVGVGANIPDRVSLNEINPHNVSAYFLPADSRNLGAVSFVGTWDRQEDAYDWTAGNVVWVPRHISSRGLMEPSVAELTDGRLLTIYRNSNQNITKYEDGRKRYTISTDGGATLSAPAELKYDDGSRFYSPSSIHQLIRHSRTGKLYWMGNVCTKSANGNSPRYPLVIAEVDEVNVALKKNTVTLIDDRQAGDGSRLQLSNFSLLEDRNTHHFEIYLTRLGEDPMNLWSANAYRYTLTLLEAVAPSEPAPAPGPLRVHPKNPRYFTDGFGRAIYLAGHQSFVDLQDNAFNKDVTRGHQRKLDWDAYLDFLSLHRFNYLRNWIIWSTGSGYMAPINNAIASPMPYRRVEGKGKAADGGNKFDLDQFDEQFFDRMRCRCEDLQERGIYVSIMLFEVYGFLGGEACGTPQQTLWNGNVFNGANNLNGIDTDENGDGKGIEFFYTSDQRVMSLRRAYVRKVIDTVNHLDNVFYEIANELHAPSWQHRMIAFIKDYEQGKPKQHLVLMSPGGRNRAGQWQVMSRDVLLDSSADCFAVTGSWDAKAYRRKDPPANNYGKPGFVDMDHVLFGSHDPGFVWSAFTRGYHFNLYDKPFESPDAEGADWQRVRRNIGRTVLCAEQMDLANAAPRADLASTGFCLAQPGQQYIVYQPGDQPFDVSGLEIGELYHFEWYDTEQCRVTGSGDVIGAGPNHAFTPPGKETVLVLKRSRR